MTDDTRPLGRPARGHAHDRARHAARRAVRRPPARRHGRRGDQGRGARQARPAARLGPGPLRGPHAAGGRCSRGTRSASRSTCASREGQELLLELVRVADVVTENFRPGTLERWNLGYDRLSAANPGIVLARISGYGQTGPVRRARRLRVRRGGDGRAPLHQRLPRRGAAAHRHLARRLARRDVRRAGHPRGALPPRRARRRAAARSSTSR